MSLIFMDGFDLYSGPTDPAFSGVYSGAGYNTNWLSTTAGRYGGGALYINAYYESITKPLPSPQAEIWLGFAYNCAGGYPVFINFNSPSGQELQLQYAASTGLWTVLRNGTQVGSTVTCSIGSGVYHWLEMHYKIGTSTSGIFELWIDGVQQINLTGVNTSAYGNTTFTSFTFGGNNNALTGFIDDMYIVVPGGANNTGRLGDSRIETLRPTSDAGPNNGTPSAGTSHFAMVNEVQNDGATTTITVTNASGQEELFGMASLAGTPTTISAVKVAVVAEETTAGTCTVEAVLVSGGTKAVGASAPLTTAFGVVSNFWEADPNTSAAWTAAAVNAMRCGFQIP